MEEESEEVLSEIKSGSRLRMAGIVLLVILLIIGGMTLRQMWPYLVQPSPELNIEGHVVEEVADGLGSPSCLHWMDETWLLVCDRDGRLLALEFDDEFSEPLVLLADLNAPHGVLDWTDSDNGTRRLFVSEQGSLSAYEISSSSPSEWNLTQPQVLVSGVPSGNHQTNTVMSDGQGGLIWHSGSTCNICDEQDERNAALMRVDPWNGSTEVIASGVRNSYDGVWVPGVGYLFTDNGRDWEGDHPPEELNLLLEGADYGWPDDDPQHPVPDGTVGPIAEFTPHSSANGIDLRPANSSLPGGERTVYVSIFGSWNTVIPVGQEIVRVDIVEDSSSAQGWRGEVSPVLEGLSTPLPLRFHPGGDLYYAEYGHGTLYRVTAS